MSEPTEHSWDYSGMPPASWSWYVREDPGLRCPATKEVAVTPNGLSYTGDAHHPNWGGGYTIGFQTFDVFLASGPLAEQMPEEIASAIRAHVLAHRRAGPVTRLALSVVVDIEGAELSRVDWALDGVSMQSHWVKPGEGPEHLFFEGMVTAGSHTLGAAFVLSSRPGLAYAKDLELTTRPGETRVRFVARGRHEVEVALDAGRTGLS